LSGKSSSLGGSAKFISLITTPIPNQSMEQILVS